MATGRTQVRKNAVLAALKEGMTRTAAASAAGVTRQALYLWMEDLTFLDAVTRAEGEAEGAFATVLRNAADGVPYERHTRTVETVIKTRKIRHPDGTVVEEPVECQQVSESTVSGVEYDWRAAESWLKRRRRAEWGDSIDVRKLDDDTLLRLLSLEERGGEAGPSITDEEYLRESVGQ